MASVIKGMVADGLTTFLWVIVATSLAPLAITATTSLGVESNLPATLAITTSLVFFLVASFDILGALLGGSSFNPTADLAFRIAGISDVSLFHLGLRFPAQVAGAVAGVIAVHEYAPEKYKHLIEGPSIKVDLHTAAAAEAVLTFGITLAVLLIVAFGPGNAFLRTLLISVCTVGVVIAGGEYTGPSLNPANAYGWAYASNNHHTWEQFYVYWISSYAGALLAGLVFRVLFSRPAEKVKKA